MPGPRRRGMLPRRRRLDDDGEDENSVAGDLDDFSVSEGSAISNGDDDADADVEGSEISGEEEDVQIPNADNKRMDSINDNHSVSRNGPQSNSLTNTQTQEAGRAVTNNADAKPLNRDELVQDRSEKLSSNIDDKSIVAAQQPSQLQDALADRSRKEHVDHIRQRSSNPAFVPNRGGFFLHDDRSATSSSPYGRPFVRGRGRGYNPGYAIGRGFHPSFSGPTDRQWAHDLHDTVNKSMDSPPATVPATFQIPTAKPAAVAPNRTFSVSTVLGNVTVQVFLPGMGSQKTFQNIVKKQHTLLPQHRPPLRRDKPVRISIPNEEPRYIFPSTERSFIFIPRAMRPNQQVYARGRGRGSFHGSRRASIMGSTYTPSIAMSRKSSLGGAGSTGLHTPTDGTIPQGPMIPNFNRPIVRMPVVPTGNPGLPASFVPSAPGGVGPVEQTNSGPTILHSPPVSLPMHQPRPQKTVSVAEIESPAVKAPQQQQEQPFHQQMPLGVNLVDGPSNQQGQPQPNMAMGTPLSHIPEGAVYAQPFQPYPMYSQGAYYGPAFPGGSMMFHNPTDPYGMSMGGPVLHPPFGTGQNFVPATQPGDGAMRPTALMHETNGMVYYYDPSQFPTDGSHMSQYPMTVGPGMVGIPAPGPYFYTGVPNGMFYPTAQQ